MSKVMKLEDCLPTPLLEKVDRKRYTADEIVLREKSTGRIKALLPLKDVNNFISSVISAGAEEFYFIKRNFDQLECLFHQTISVLERIEFKVDQLLSDNKNDFLGSIGTFEDQYRTYQDGSGLANCPDIHSKGVKIINSIKLLIPEMREKYFDSCSFGNRDYIFGHCPDLVSSDYFKMVHVYFSYAERLNAIALHTDGCEDTNYQSYIEFLKGELVGALKKVIRPSNLTTIYDVLYQGRSLIKDDNRFYINQNDLYKIIKYDPTEEFNIQQLICMNFDANMVRDYDSSSVDLALLLIKYIEELDMTLSPKGGVRKVKLTADERSVFFDKVVALQ